LAQVIFACSPAPKRSDLFVRGTRVTMNKVLCCLVAGFTLAAGEAAELDASTFDSALESGNAFVKFLAPW